MGLDDGTRYGQTDPHPIYLRSNKSIKDSFLIGNSRSIAYHLNEHLILIRRGCSNDDVRRNLATSNASIAFEIKIDEHLHLSQVNGNRGKMLIQLPINRNVVLSWIPM